jgi:UDP-N-acetyl-D-glucosamine dehydrogenase
MMVEELIHRIEKKKALVGVIGMGYVGLPLVLRFCEQGFRTLGFDIDPRKVAALKKGKSYIKTIPSSKIARAVRDGRFDVTDDFSRLGKPDCILICVPTPLTEKMEPDLQYIEKTTDCSGKHHLPRNNRGICSSSARIDRPEGGKRLLPGFFS